jgi:putative sigma-54 modulation protein
MQEKVLLSGVHVELTDAIRSYAHEKAARLLRHDPDLIRIRLELEFQHHRSHFREFRATGRVEGGHRGDFSVASAKCDDLYRAIDEVVEKLDRQLQTKS